MLAPTREPTCLCLFLFHHRKNTDSVVCACLPGRDRFSQHGSFFLVAHIIFSLTTYHRYYCIVYVSSHLQPNQILYCTLLLAWFVVVHDSYVCAKFNSGSMRCLCLFFIVINYLTLVFIFIYLTLIFLF